MRKLLQALGMQSRNEQTIEQWFDGDSTSDARARAAMESDPEAARYAAHLAHMRAGVEAIRNRPGIGDEQLPAFLGELRGKIEQGPATGSPAPWNRWALSTATAVVAAIAVAFGLFIVTTGGHTQVEARTEVQEYATEMPGATIEVNEGVIFISHAGER